MLKKTTDLWCVTVPFFCRLLSFPCMKLCLRVLRLHRWSCKPSSSRQTYYTNLNLSPSASVGLYSTRINLWAWLAKGFFDIIHDVHLNAKNVGPPPRSLPLADSGDEALTLLLFLFFGNACNRLTEEKIIVVSGARLQQSPRSHEMMCKRRQFTVMDHHACD